MKERPILFKSEMVSAILDGRKTQTRRIIKRPKYTPLDYILRPDLIIDIAKTWWQNPNFDRVGQSQDCPHGKPGDRLWVRENGWERPARMPKMMREGADTWEPYYFDADGYTDIEHEQFKEWGFKRRPSIHMPRWASRIDLEITDVRVERLQDISVGDCCSEGAPLDTRHDVETWYRELWETINGHRSWESNPWLWVIEFKRIKP